MRTKVGEKSAEKGKVLTEEETDAEVLKKYIEDTDILSDPKSMEKLAEASPKLAGEIGKWVDEAYVNAEINVQVENTNNDSYNKTDNLNKSVVKIESFIAGNKTFEEVCDDYAQIYSTVVNTNKVWSWRKNIIGGSKLTKRQRKNIKQRAVENALIPTVNIKRINGMKYGFADFKSAGVVKETILLPENLWRSSDKVQFEWLNKQIGGKKAGYTWHHTEEPGKMELVPTGIHNITAHNGGRSKNMWAERHIKKGAIK